MALPSAVPGPGRCPDHSLSSKEACVPQQLSSARRLTVCDCCDPPGTFMELMKTSSVLRNNVITSGLYFYLYNELSTLTIKKTSATTQSVANTAKRVIVIVGVAIALGESLEPVKMLGCAIGIGGVLLYSLAK